MGNFALGRNLAVTRKLYQHKDIHKVTRRSRGNKMCNQIDRRQCANIYGVRSVRGAEIELDHFSEGQN